VEVISSTPVRNTQARRFKGLGLLPRHYEEDSPMNRIGVYTWKGVEMDGDFEEWSDNAHNPYM